MKFEDFIAGQSWSCHICGDSRPDANISVRVHDVSADSGLPYGTFKNNVRYCNDRPRCVEESLHFRFGRKNEKKEEPPKTVRRFLNKVWWKKVLGIAA